MHARPSAYLHVRNMHASCYLHLQVVSCFKTQEASHTQVTTPRRSSFENSTCFGLGFRAWDTGLDCQKPLDPTGEAPARQCIGKGAILEGPGENGSLNERGCLVEHLLVTLSQPGFLGGLDGSHQSKNAANLLEASQFKQKLSRT